MNQQLIVDMGLMEPTITQAKDKTLQKVKDRLETLRAQRPLPVLDERTVVLVDDGLASGITMETAITAVRSAHPARVVVAVPTGRDAVLRRIAMQVDDFYCANVRGGWGFAVASAYRQWRDISDEEARDILAELMA
jgi:predicted phosphoribosyltransferase